MKSSRKKGILTLEMIPEQMEIKETACIEVIHCIIIPAGYVENVPMGSYGRSCNVALATLYDLLSLSIKQLRVRSLSARADQN